MNKILLTITALGITALNVYAQTGPANGVKESGKFSIGFDGGLPVGNASEIFSAVVGGSLRYEVPTATKTWFTITAGVNKFLLKNEFKKLGPTSVVIPLKAGIKYYTEGDFFLEGQLGIAFSTAKDEGTSFVYAPGFGYTFGAFEASVRYEGWPKDGTTTSQIGLRLAVVFK
jgi:hypothetical protein